MACYLELHLSQGCGACIANGYSISTTSLPCYLSFFLKSAESARKCRVACVTSLVLELGLDALIPMPKERREGITLDASQLTAHHSSLEPLESIDMVRSHKISKHSLHIPDGRYLYVPILPCSYAGVFHFSVHPLINPDRHLLIHSCHPISVAEIADTHNFTLQAISISTFQPHSIDTSSRSY